MTLRRSPFGFLTIIMRCTHFVVSPWGTGSITPSAMSFLRSSSTLASQWIGTFDGVLIALPLAEGSICILIGGPFILGSAWWGQLLKTDDEYVFSSQDFIWGTFGEALLADLGVVFVMCRDIFLPQCPVSGKHVQNKCSYLV